MVSVFDSQAVFGLIPQFSESTRRQDELSVLSLSVLSNPYLLLNDKPLYRLTVPAPKWRFIVKPLNAP